MKSNQDTKFVSFYKNVSLALVFLMFPCLLIEDLLSQTGINIIIGQLLIFSNLAFVFCISLTKFTLSKFQKHIIIFLILILIYLLMTAIFLNEEDFVFLLRLYIKQILFGIMFIVILNYKKFNLKRLSNFIIYLSFILSLMSIILFVGYYFGFIELVEDTADFAKVSRRILRGSIFGYLNYAEIYSDFPRSQSFWTEPARFAQFLILPLTLSIIECFNDKNIKSYVICITIFIAFLLTFSIASIGGCLIALTIYLVLKKSKYRIISKLIIKLSSILIIIGFGLVLYEYSFDVGVTRKTVISKAGSSSVNIKFKSLISTLEHISHAPFGDISFFSKYRGRKTTFGNLLFIGGIPLFLFFIIFLIYFYYNIFKCLRYGKYGIIYCGAIGYIIAFVWFGDFFNYYYLFLVALLSTYIKYDKEYLPIII